MRFADRAEAGRLLAERLLTRLAPADLADVVVLGLPRGGVAVAAEVAQVLAAPLDVIAVRKLGVPSWPELAMGALGEDGVRVYNQDVIRQAGVTDRQIRAVEATEQAELERRLHRLRGAAPPLEVRDRIAVIVDDGIATGATARAACEVARARGARRVVVATPVGAPDALDRLAGLADEVVCERSLGTASAIGAAYDAFDQVADGEVARLLSTARAGSGARSDSDGDPGDDVIARDVSISADGIDLPGYLRLPAGWLAVVAFAHGSGSSRYSPRNRYVADVLADHGLGTLQFDLLTEPEAADRQLVFDIALLAARLRVASRWLRAVPEVADRPIGLFGASTGAAAALTVAADLDCDASAVVSRGGRPDLAVAPLAAVRAPTLLIVGGDDRPVLDLNVLALGQLTCEKKLEVIRGATHLFEEPGALAQVADLSAAWFRGHVTQTGHSLPA